MNWVDPYIHLAGAQLLVWVPKLLLGCACFLVFWFAARWAHRFLDDLGLRAPRDQRAVFDLAGEAARYGLLLFGTITALGTLGIQVGALIAGLGLTGFALGFALKDAVSNLLAGVLILVYRPFRKHDKIKVTSFEGEVQEIDLRYTTLHSEGNRILIPNSVLISNPIVVYSDT